MTNPTTDDNTIKSGIRKRLDEVATELTTLSRRIHAHPETAFEEHRAAAWCTDLLRTHGFAVTAPAYGLPTAFEATVGSGPVTVALACEYDALPGLGHACGHNLIAAAGVGAALALAPFADELGLTVRVLGTPAEESGGGKALLLSAGAFDGVDAAMMIHPCPFDVADFHSYAMGSLDITYTGKSAHAAMNPEDGRNAADALTVAQVALGLLRQQLPAEWKVHGITTSAGTALNAIPESAHAAYALRTPSAAELDTLRARVENCFRAGALATGCEVTLAQPSPDYLDFRSDPELVALWTANARAVGRPEPEVRGPFASTDMGNVSHAVPSIHPVLNIGASSCGPHQPEFTAAAATPAAERTMLEGALSLAWTASDLATHRTP
ncbi:putative peptidase/amidohydrolase [Streptomyces spiroverticillatus]|uniref:Peptidase M20 domain-containing protein 2 n=1 Tax=Streptomyces finlayi TaxID=67296 RepID=A0A919CB91_9ACTN|nr:M20 family metallopeptidase [Streptomyces finlayi]GHA13942.1 putative peptidase/amidohydrolase [Streptomyces spiroverticillatus]GHC97625.1 putative peptidase/amidohydrolase [Streptomyces finlayi]